MNKQRSFFEQFLISTALAFAAMWIMQNYFGGNKGNAVADRKLPEKALVQAFKGIDPSQGPVLDEAKAKAEVKTLEADIKKNEHDDYARYAKLRLGLIQQYILDDLTTETRKSGFLGLGPRVQYIRPYDDLAHLNRQDEIEAQALYQMGDLFWRRGVQKNEAQSSSDAVTAFEYIISHERSNKNYRTIQIFVPVEKDPAKVPLEGPPPGGFTQVKIEDLRGTLPEPNPQGVLDRVNAFYSTTTLYKLFDSMVKAFQENPTYSYGLAIIVFAIVTRVLMQPLSKKQYDSMKGMQLIAPEMKKIQDKYKGKTDSDSQMAMVKEIQALQRRHGVNPYMGCFLGFLQMPIFFLIVYPMINHYQSKMDLSGASFLWIGSLAQPDYILLALYGLSMFVSFRLSSTPPTDETQRQMQIMMSFMMPFMLPLFLLTYPSAFVMYWMMFNLTATLLQWRMMKAADPHKNMVKTLMGADLRTPIASTESKEDAVPARPKGKNETPAEKKGGTAVEKKNGKALPADGESISKNGLNGHANGNASTNGNAAASSGSKKKKR